MSLDVWMRCKQKYYAFKDLPDPLSCVEEDGVYTIHWKHVFCIVGRYMMMVYKKGIIPTEFDNIEEACKYLFLMIESI